MPNLTSLTKTEIEQHFKKIATTGTQLAIDTQQTLREIISTSGPVISHSLAPLVEYFIEKAPAKNQVNPFYEQTLQLNLRKLSQWLRKDVLLTTEQKSKLKFLVHDIKERIDIHESYIKATSPLLLLNIINWSLDIPEELAWISYLCFISCLLKQIIPMRLTAMIEDTLKTLQLPLLIASTSAEVDDGEVQLSAKIFNSISINIFFYIFGEAFLLLMSWVQFDDTLIDKILWPFFMLASIYIYSLFNGFNIRLYTNDLEARELAHTLSSNPHIPLAYGGLLFILNKIAIHLVPTPLLLILLPIITNGLVFHAIHFSPRLKYAAVENPNSALEILLNYSDGKLSKLIDTLYKKHPSIIPWLLQIIKTFKQEQESKDLAEKLPPLAKDLRLRLINSKVIQQFSASVLRMLAEKIASATHILEHPLLKPLLAHLKTNFNPNTKKLEPDIIIGTLISYLSLRTKISEAIIKVVIGKLLKIKFDEKIVAFDEKINNMNIRLIRTNTSDPKTQNRIKAAVSTTIFSTTETTSSMHDAELAPLSPLGRDTIIDSHFTVELAPRERENEDWVNLLTPAEKAKTEAINSSMADWEVIDVTTINPQQTNNDNTTMTNASLLTQADQQHQQTTPELLGEDAFCILPSDKKAVQMSEEVVEKLKTILRNIAIALKAQERAEAAEKTRLTALAKQPIHRVGMTAA